MMYLQFESVSTERDIIHAKPAPSIEWHLTKDKEQFDLLTVSVGTRTGIFILHRNKHAPHI